MPSLQNRNKAVAEEQKRVRKLANITERDGHIEVYGSGDSALLKQLRGTKGLTARGYYQLGTLASLLARDRIAVAVFPSIWPDPYGMVVPECLAVGIPVIAFDLGAVADRLNFWEVGRVVRRQHGAPGLATAM
jgi:glycosyltransferase involved in cell wall biosynthesis